MALCEMTSNYWGFFNVWLPSLALMLLREILRQSYIGLVVKTEKKNHLAYERFSQLKYYMLYNGACLLTTPNSWLEICNFNEFILYSCI